LGFSFCLNHIWRSLPYKNLVQWSVVSNWNHFKNADI
jgi:hypothetical protein